MSLMLATVLLGCQEGCVETTTISRLKQNDVFIQEPSAQVDILWVVDNSPSMEAEQQRVADGFTEFISGISDTQIDFHIGVITTDMDMSNPDRGVLIGSTPFLTNLDDYVAEFQDRVKVGVDGSDKEKGLAAALYSLTEPIISGPNYGFMREEAVTSIIFVSDEDDCSDGEALSDEPGSACYDKSNELIPVKDYVQAFRSLKPPGVRLVTSAIVGPDASEGCTESWPGKRYMTVADATGGVSGNICDALYSEIMYDLGLAVTGVQTLFQLSYSAMEESIEVWVGDASGNGELIPQDTVGGWSYDSTYWTIRFDGDYYPPRGTTVSVEYEIGSPAEWEDSDTE